MKQTPLKPGKPLKRTGFKRKKKSSLQKRIDKMDSAYWNRKCQAAVAAWAHRQPCLVCGRKEPNVLLMAGHHLILKSRSRLYRWHPMNIVPLDDVHHLSSITCAAHSDNPLAVAAFVERLETFEPEKYQWLVEHAAAMRKTDMRVGQIERPDWREQAEYWESLL